MREIYIYFLLHLKCLWIRVPPEERPLTCAACKQFRSHEGMFGVSNIVAAATVFIEYSTKIRCVFDPVYTVCQKLHWLISASCLSLVVFSSGHSNKSVAPDRINGRVKAVTRGHSWRVWSPAPTVHLLPALTERSHKGVLLPAGCCCCFFKTNTVLSPGWIFTYNMYKEKENW